MLLRTQWTARRTLHHVQDGLSCVPMPFSAELPANKRPHAPVGIFGNR